ncbi:MAG: HAMP domain-containing histidine kinase [Gammaproteobacteria bacterium]|nr:HAMP domain-containing histidine kinase [Gammaproteobacteria bacterium]
MKNHCIFIIIINLLVGGLLLWVGSSRMNELRELHDNIATESVSLVTNNVALFIQDKNRLINIFVENETGLIRQLAKSPDSDELNQQLSSRIKHYFPHFFTFTIANKQGAPLLEDFDSFVGDICLKDLKRFADYKQTLPRIHPNPEAYHFDVISNYGNDEGILFISFHADILGNILKSVEAHKHQLLLIMEAGLDLIEVTADGARNHWIRDDYRMLNDEKDRILAMKNIPGTVWSATDLYQPTLFSATRNQIVIQSVATLSILVIVSILFLLLISRTQKRREEAENIRDDFLSMISHELRTPLATIRGSLGLIIGGAGGTLPTQAESLTRTVLKNTDRMIVLINDLLDLRKLEARHIKSDMQPVNLLKVTKNSIYLTSEYGKEFGVSYTLLCHEDICNKEPCASGLCDENPCEEKRIIIMANEHRIEQVINNLLSNAAKHGATNETVEVSLSVENKMARIEIRDKGQGVPPSIQPYLFEKRPRLSQNKVAQNMGHGLTIVNYIVKLHHGRTGYETRPGYGAIFFIELPVIPRT